VYGDFSRITFNRAKGYTALWAQQGRMQLDADYNEQTAIFLDWLRTFALDFIGPFGGNITRAGFKVQFDDQKKDLILSPGHYYVHGLRCEVPATGTHGHPVTVSYRNQCAPTTGTDPLPRQPYLAYLLVWEQSVSARVDPDLLEPALGPLAPDTMIRSQVSWRLQLWQDQEAVKELSCDVEAIAEEFETWNSPTRPQMRACTRRDTTGVDADDAVADRGYVGVENQLYRVEVHSGGRIGEGPTFKWSRDNGSAEFGIDSIGVSETPGGGFVTNVVLEKAGRGELEIGACVEVVDDNWMPSGNPQPLLSVIAVDRGAGSVTLSGAVDTDVSLHPYLRRWDHPVPGPDGIAVTESTWIDLEDGIEVSFGETGATYHRGDYWLVPARTAIGDVLWPQDDGVPLALPPHGPHRYLAPLALVDNGDVQDLRTLFTHLAWPDPTIGEP
jgi:hypothetical protein